jgi:hypothetical protein
MEKIVAVLHKHFIGGRSKNMSTSISNPALPPPFPNLPLRNRGYTPL